MTRYRALLWSALIATVSASVAWYATRAIPRDCEAEVRQSAISVRSGELCSQTINCKMSYENVRAIVSERVQAEGCK